MEQLCIGNFGLATETIPLFAYKNCAKRQILVLLSMGHLTQAREPPDEEPIGEGLFSVLFIPTGQVIRKKSQSSISTALSQCAEDKHRENKSPILFPVIIYLYY